MSEVPGITVDRSAQFTEGLKAPLAMYQNWRKLLFLHWEVEAELLASKLPPGLSLDTFEGRAFVGLVPFTMCDIRPKWAPAVPPLSNFHETNVRTYVHYKGKDPGVWFFSLDAANSIAVRIARAVYKLPYYRADMHLITNKDGVTEYSTARLWPEPTPGNCKVIYRPTGSPAPSTSGTLEHFLAERYLLYTAAGSDLYRGEVYHTPYPIQGAEVIHLEENLLKAAGIVRGTESPMALYASGVDVKVGPLQRCR